jgi:hypothetical protein
LGARLSQPSEGGETVRAWLEPARTRQVEPSSIPGDTPPSRPNLPVRGGKPHDVCRAAPTGEGCLGGGKSSHEREHSTQDGRTASTLSLGRRAAVRGPWTVLFRARDDVGGRVSTLPRRAPVRGPRGLGRSQSDRSLTKPGTGRSRQGSVRGRKHLHARSSAAPAGHRHSPAEHPDGSAIPSGCSWAGYGRCDGRCM